MASITPKANGTYLIRISCGIDTAGKQIVRSKTFKPSRPNLSYQKLNKEIDAFIEQFKEELDKEQKGIVRFDKMTLADFAKKYLSMKKTVLSPTTYPFYENIINTEIIPKFGHMKLSEIRTYHVQDLLEFEEKANIPHIRTIRGAIMELRETRPELGIGEEHIRRCVANGRISSIKIGCRRYIAMQSFDAPYCEKIMSVQAPSFAKSDMMRRDILEQMSAAISAQVVIPKIRRANLT